MAATAVGLAVAGGRAAVTARGEWAAWSWIAAALPLGAGFLLAALTEELMFRGYPLRRLADAVGAGPATAIAGAGVAPAHPRNPDAPAVFTVHLGLGGGGGAAARLFPPGPTAPAGG